jgi:pre-mRNA-splicing factor SYF1
MNAAFEEALTKLPKMPRLWLMYTGVLAKQHLVQKTRQVYNWSFRNLPLTQHEKIWSKFTAWAMSLENTSTAIAIIPRYLKLNPDFK